jgi:4-hydroxybenzoate polyprenyltransferase
LPSRVLSLRAWRLALAGPSVYWFFPIFYVLLSSHIRPSPLGLFGLMMALVLSASWGFLINDLADRESDAKSGRQDDIHGHGIGRGRMYAMILATAGGSWAIVFAIGGGVPFKVVLAINYLIAFLYSCPPARLKVRGFWGFLANSLIERPLPVLVILTYMRYYTAATVLLPVLVELTWSVFKHQAADIKGDSEAKVRTFAVSLGEAASTRIVESFLNPLSVVALLALTALALAGAPELRVPLGVVFSVVLVGALSAYFIERRGSLRVYFTPTDPPYIIFLNLAYRYLLLPVLGVGLALLLPGYYLLVAFLAVSLAFQLFLYAGLLKKSRSLLSGKGVGNPSSTSRPSA